MAGGATHFPSNGKEQNNTELHCRRDLSYFLYELHLYIRKIKYTYLNILVLFQIERGRNNKHFRYISEIHSCKKHDRLNTVRKKCCSVGFSKKNFSVFMAAYLRLCQ